MYAVIFKAKTNELDNAYRKVAERMRELAMNDYGCTEFISVTEGDQEISISYWSSLSDIADWKQNAEHLVAQDSGKNSWYKSYHVQVVELIREYKEACK